MLIDKYLPTYQFSEKHEILLCTPPEVIYKSIRTADFAENIIVKGLLALRLLPSIIIRPKRVIEQFKERHSMAVRLSDFEKSGFHVLEEVYPNEIVIGLEGKFWTLDGSIKSISKESFVKVQSPSVARAVWNFRIENCDETTRKCRLITETRVSCTGNETLRKFSLYWYIIRPWSGLIRRYILRAIRKEAMRN